MSKRYDYVTVGHVTCDVIEDHPGGPVRQPGGGAFYSALQAARLGLDTLILTQGVPVEIEQLLAPYLGELDVEVLPASATTTLATHGSGATRVQRVHAWAGAIRQPSEPSGAIVHFAPVVREIPPGARASGSFIGVTPQGLVRRWDTSGTICAVELDPRLLPLRMDAAVISDRESTSCAPLLERAPAVAVTAGSAPIRLYLPDGTVSQIAPVRVRSVIDDLGAGDVFAAAFFAALAAGRMAQSAAHFASAAAAVRVTAEGPAAVGDTAAIESLL